MSERTKTQFEETFARLASAVSDVDRSDDVVKKREALRDVVSLCDAFKASATGYQASLGYQKRETETQTAHERRGRMER